MSAISFNIALQNSVSITANWRPDKGHIDPWHKQSQPVGLHCRSQQTPYATGELWDSALLSAGHLCVCNAWTSLHFIDNCRKSHITEFCIFLLSIVCLLFTFCVPLACFFVHLLHFCDVFLFTVTSLVKLSLFIVCFFLVNFIYLFFKCVLQSGHRL